jgi:hypothetical protein
MKPISNQWTVLASKSFQDFDKGIHTIYMDTTKKMKVTEECLC